MAAKWVARDDKRRMPVKDSLLFNTRRQCRVAKIHPIHHTELHRRLIRQYIRCKFWWMRHCSTTYLLLRINATDVQKLLMGYRQKFRYPRAEHGSKHRCVTRSVQLDLNALHVHPDFLPEGQQL